MQRVRELVQFGGFTDCDYLKRTLVKEFQQMESRYKCLLPLLSTFSPKYMFLISENLNDARMELPGMNIYVYNLPG